MRVYSTRSGRARFCRTITRVLSIITFLEIIR